MDSVNQPKIHFSNLLSTLRLPEFKTELKHEIERLRVSQLPLQKCLSSTSVALDKKLNVMILNVTEEQESVNVKAGVFYSGIDAGCSCIDDPTPIEEQTEYCELLFRIDKETGEASVELLD